MPFILVSKKSRSSLPTACRMMINPSTKSKNIDDVGVKRKASQDLIDYVTKIKRSKSEKKPSLFTVESEKPRKCEHIEVAAAPKPIVMSSEKAVQVCTPKKAAGDAAANSSLQDMILKVKLSKLGGDGVTTVDESEKLNKEHLRKEKIEKEREALRITLDKMKPTTELFEDNLSVMKEFEESYGLRYFDSQSHEQFVHSKLYDCSIKDSHEHNSSRSYSNPPTKLKNIDGSVLKRKASQKLIGDGVAKTKHSNKSYSNPPTKLKNIDGSVKRKASKKLMGDEAAKTKCSSRSYSNPPTKLKNIDHIVKRKASQKLTADEVAKTKCNRSELAVKKMTPWVSIASKETDASEKQKPKEKEGAAVVVPVSTTIYVEKDKQVFTPKKATQVPSALKEKLSKLEVDKTIKAVEADKFRKESLQKERDKEREASEFPLII